MDVVPSLRCVVLCDAVPAMRHGQVQPKQWLHVSFQLFGVSSWHLLLPRLQRLQRRVPWAVRAGVPWGAAPPPPLCVCLAHHPMTHMESLCPLFASLSSVLHFRSCRYAQGGYTYPCSPGRYVIPKGRAGSALCVSLEGSTSEHPEAHTLSGLTMPLSGFVVGAATGPAVQPPACAQACA